MSGAGDVMTRMQKKHVTCSRRQLPGMKQSSSRDARGMDARSLRELELRRKRYGERDVHAAILANPCLMCGMHSYGKGIDEPGVARRARS